MRIVQRARPPRSAIAPDRTRARRRPPPRGRWPPAAAGRGTAAAAPPPRSAARRAPPGSRRRATARRGSSTSSTSRRAITPDAASTPSAIGRSNDAPALRTSAGARLTVMRCCGNSKPELRMALRMRSRLSRTLASGSPTIVKPGRPNETSTSMVTGDASMPKTAAERTHASMRRSAMQTRAQPAAAANFRRNRRSAPRRVPRSAATPHAYRPTVSTQTFTIRNSDRTAGYFFIASRAASRCS